MEENNEIIWLEKDMFMKNIGLFGEVSVDYLEILENAIEENVIHHTFDEYLYILEGELLVFKGDEKKLMKLPAAELRGVSFDSKILIW